MLSKMKRKQHRESGKPSPPKRRNLDSENHLKNRIESSVKSLLLTEVTDEELKSSHVYIKPHEEALCIKALKNNNVLKLCELSEKFKTPSSHHIMPNEVFDIKTKGNGISNGLIIANSSVKKFTMSVSHKVQSSAKSFMLREVTDEELKSSHVYIKPHEDALCIKALENNNVLKLCELPEKFKTPSSQHIMSNEVFDIKTKGNNGLTIANSSVKKFTVSVSRKALEEESLFKGCFKNIELKVQEAIRIAIMKYCSGCETNCSTLLRYLQQIYIDLINYSVNAEAAIQHYLSYKMDFRYLFNKLRELRFSKWLENVWQKDSKLGQRIITALESLEDINETVEEYEKESETVSIKQCTVYLQKLDEKAINKATQRGSSQKLPISNDTKKTFMAAEIAGRDVGDSAHLLKEADEGTEVGTKELPTGSNAREIKEKITDRSGMIFVYLQNETERRPYAYIEENQSLISSEDNMKYIEMKSIETNESEMTKEILNSRAVNKSGDLLKEDGVSEADKNYIDLASHSMDEAETKSDTDVLKANKRKISQKGTKIIYIDIASDEAEREIDEEDIQLKDNMKYIEMKSVETNESEMTKEILDSRAVNKSGDLLKEDGVSEADKNYIDLASHSMDEAETENYTEVVKANKSEITQKYIIYMDISSVSSDEAEREIDEEDKQLKDNMKYIEMKSVETNESEMTKEIMDSRAVNKSGDLLKEDGVSEADKNYIDLASHSMDEAETENYTEVVKANESEITQIPNTIICIDIADSSDEEDEKIKQPLAGNKNFQDCEVNNGIHRFFSPTRLNKNFQNNNIAAWFASRENMPTLNLQERSFNENADVPSSEAPNCPSSIDENQELGTRKKFQ